MKSQYYKAVVQYYDAENDHYDMLHRDVPFLLEHMPSRSQSVLELAVGTGRVAIPLAQAGHRVVGVDFDPAILAIARRKRDAVGLTDRQLSLLCASALDVSLDRRFDWVCILFNTLLNFTTLEQQDQLLQNVRRHLKPRGRFWLDIFQPNPAIMAAGHSEGLDPFVFYVPELERTVARVTDVDCDSARQLQQLAFNYTWFDTDGGEHHERTRFELTFLFPRELQLLLERNGFHMESLYGDYDGSPVTDSSPRLIACCKLA